MKGLAPLCTLAPIVVVIVVAIAVFCVPVFTFHAHICFLSISEYQPSFEYPPSESESDDEAPSKTTTTKTTAPTATTPALTTSRTRTTKNNTWIDNDTEILTTTRTNKRVYSEINDDFEDEDDDDSYGSYTSNKRRSKSAPASKKKRKSIDYDDIEEDDDEDGDYGVTVKHQANSFGSGSKTTNSGSYLGPAKQYSHSQNGNSNKFSSSGTIFKDNDNVCNSSLIFFFGTTCAFDEFHFISELQFILIPFPSM